LMGANKFASTRIHRCSTSPSGVFQRVSNPRNGWVFYEQLIQGHKVSAEVGERYGISCRYLALGSTSCKGSRFGHRTLLAIIACSRQRVAYTCIRTWGIPKGSNDYHYRGLPQDKPWDTRQSKDNRSLDTTSAPPTTTIARLRLTSQSNTIALCRNTE
jgi:hypothetical protein